MKKTMFFFSIVPLIFVFGQATLLKDIYPGKGSGINTVYPSYVLLQNKLYFIASDSIHGHELWVTDGTSQNTRLLKDINPGLASSNICGMRTDGTSIFFVAKSGVNSQVYRSDGTDTGTRIIRVIGPADSIYGAACGCLEDEWNNKLMNGQYYFVANDSVHGSELWKTDGTASGTVMVIDLSPDTAGSNPSYMVVDSSKLFFLVGKNKANPDALWVTDGTASGSFVLMSQTTFNNSSGITMTMNQHLLYFKAAELGDGFRFWVTDGTALGTYPLNQTCGFSSCTPHAAKVINGVLYYMESYPYPRVKFIKGIAAGVKDMVYYDAGEMGNLNSWWKGDNYWLYKGNVYIPGEVAFNKMGIELYRSQLGHENVSLVKNIAVGSYSSRPIDGFVYCDYLYFSAADSDHGMELWRTDGTEKNTTIAFDFNKGKEDGRLPFGSFRGIQQVLGDKLLITAFTEEEGHELWLYDCKIPFAGVNVIQSKIAVYPNPVEDILFVKEVPVNTFFQLYTIYGNLIQAGELPAEGLSVAHLTAGTYHLVLRSFNESTSDRFLKQ